MRRTAIACSVGISSASVPAPCSRSTSSQSKPAREQASAATGEPRLRNAPTSDSPAARRSLVVEALELVALTLVVAPPLAHLGFLRDLRGRDVPPHVRAGEVAVWLRLAHDHARPRLAARRFEGAADRKS